MRISSGTMINNFLRRLSELDTRLVKLQNQVSTGNLFNRPGENPAGSAQVMSIGILIEHLVQYRDNMYDGKSRLDFMDENLGAVGDYMHRARELAVQGANTHLSDTDRRAIALELDQIIRGVGNLSNADHNSKYLYAGYQTLRQPFELAFGSSNSYVGDVFYRGDAGVIARNIGNASDIDVNFTGKEVFMGQTQEFMGRAVTGKALGYSGFFRINGKTVNIFQTDTLLDVRNKINGTKDIGVVARIDPNFKLRLESLSAVGDMRLEDTGGRILENLGLIERGAYNIAESPPALPLIDSLGAIKTGTVLPDFPSPPGPGVTIDETNNRLVLRLGPSANDGDSVRVAVTLTQGNYATIGELVDMLQTRIDAGLGAGKVIVRENAGAIELETGANGSGVLAQDFVIGGQDPQGLPDTASVMLGLTAAGGPETADSGGTDGNDMFTINLGITAHPNGLDLDPVVIDIDAAASLTVSGLADSINDGIRQSKLNGLVEASVYNGRLMFETTLKGKEVLGADLEFADVTAGTLAALGIVNATSSARVIGTAGFPPGITITAGVDDSFNIDLGPAASGDWSDPPPQTLTLTAGAYLTASALSAEINAAILANPVLNGNVEAITFSIAGVEFVELRTLAAGSGVDISDLTLTDALPGALANLGLAGPTIPGGGSTDGTGEKIEAENLFASLIRLRDDMLGVAEKTSKLTEMMSAETNEWLGLLPNDRIEITAGGNTLTVSVRDYTTLGDLSKELGKFLGIGVDVYVTGDGRIYLENISNQPIPGFSIKAYSPQGGERAVFNKAFERFTGTVLPQSTIYSSFLKDESRFESISLLRLGEVEDARLHVIDYRSRTGSAVRRLEFGVEQSEAFEVQLYDRKLQVQGADMAEVITRFQAEENILRAVLSMGSRVIPATLFDFLR